MKLPVWKAFFGGLLLVIAQLSYAGGTWTPISKTDLGSLPHNQVSKMKVYSVPMTVPTTAKEILVYAYIRTGSGNPDADIEVRIYTQSGRNTQYSFYLFAHGYNQAAWSYNSQSFWLPLTEYRAISAISSGSAMKGEAASQLSIIGYR
jgi:hypothetical protein